MRVDASLFLYEPADKETLVETINAHDDMEEPLFQLTHPEAVYVEQDEGLLVNGAILDDMYFSFRMPFTGSDRHREIVKELVRLTGLHRKYKADDRGRVTIGQQYSDQTVEIVVISEPEE